MEPAESRLKGSTLIVEGSYREPQTIQLTAGNHYLPVLGLEPLNVLGLPPPLKVWRYGAESQLWQTHLGGPPPFISDLPDFLPPGEAVFVQAEQPAEIKPPNPKLNTRFYHQDHLGSSAVVASLIGEIIEETAFYPFGSPRHEFNPLKFIEDYKFTQKERDRESGLSCFGSRYLSSSINHFISFDPALASPATLEQPQTFNPYSYAGNRPLSHNDPDGNFISAVITAGFAAYDTYQYATGKISGGEYAGRMALNAVALAADVATGGTGGGMAVRAASLAARGGKVGTAALKGVVAADRLITTKARFDTAISLKDSVAAGDLKSAGLTLGVTGAIALGGAVVSKHGLGAPKLQAPHRGRIQAQGKKLDESIPWDRSSPPTVSEGLAMIDALEKKIPKSAAKLRSKQFEKAREYVRRAGTKGGVVAYPKNINKTYGVPGTKHERVDIEVSSGTAFIPDPVPNPVTGSK